MLPGTHARSEVNALHSFLNDAVSHRTIVIEQATTIVRKLRDMNNCKCAQAVKMIMVWSIKMAILLPETSSSFESYQQKQTGAVLVYGLGSFSKYTYTSPTWMKSVTSDNYSSIDWCNDGLCVFAVKCKTFFFVNQNKGKPEVTTTPVKVGKPFILSLNTRWTKQHFIANPTFNFRN